MKQKIHVAVGLILNKANQYLISKRHPHLHQGGLWEFPGGKVEPGESVYAALCRELHEELNLDVVHAKPFLKLSYAYPDKDVILDVWQVDKFNGKVESSTAQPINWVPREKLYGYTFPAANNAILKALALPTSYAITGSFFDNEDYIQQFKQCLNRGSRLIQLRQPDINSETLLQLAKISKSLSLQYNAKLIVNADINFLQHVEVDGIHLNSQRLFQYRSRPITTEKIFAASVHNSHELQQAMMIGVDFVVASPVLETTSHPGATLLGWKGLEKIIAQSSIPVYALGGMKTELLPQAKNKGAYGIAAITEFWKTEK